MLLDRLYALRQSRHLAGGGILVNDALLRTDERTWLTRFLLMTARRVATRVAFFAELVFAMKSHPESWNLSILVQCKNAAARF